LGAGEGSIKEEDGGEKGLGDPEKRDGAIHKEKRGVRTRGEGSLIGGHWIGDLR